MFDTVLICLFIIVCTVSTFVFVEHLVRSALSDLLEGQVNLIHEIRSHHESVMNMLRDMDRAEHAHYREVAQRVTRVDIADDMK